MRGQQWSVTLRYKSIVPSIFTLLHPETVSVYFASLYQGQFSLGLKRPGREADHSSPSSAEVKNAWNYTSTPLIRLHDVVPS
jgi:hypothetical protein